MPFLPSKPGDWKPDSSMARSWLTSVWTALWNMTYPQATKTTNFNLLDGEYYVANPSTNPIIASLPPALGIPGRTYTVKSISSSNGLTIARATGDTIDGAAADITISTSGVSYTLVSDGVSNWITVANAVVSPTATSPGGSNTQVQFNDSGVLGGDADFTWDKTNNVLSVGSTTTAGLVKMVGDSAANKSPLASWFRNTTGEWVGHVNTGGTWCLAWNPASYSDANLATADKLFLSSAGDLTLTGNATIGGTLLQMTANVTRIKGPYSNATHNNRPIFINDQANANTRVGAAPTGSGTAAGWLAYSNSDLTAALNSGQFQQSGTNTILDANVLNGGTQGALNFQIGAVNKLAITSTGDINMTPTAVANGELWTYGSATELLTLSTVGLTTDTSANLLPANSIIEAVVCRITTTITLTTNWAVGDPTTSNRFSSANATLASGTTSVGLNHWSGAVNTLAAGPSQATAAKVRITCTGANPGAGVIRITVFYRTFTPPTA